MDTYNATHSDRFTALLARREAELRAVLAATGDPGAHVPEVQPHEVQDFKDYAVEESMAVVDDAQALHAAQELEQIRSARLRLEDHSYGLCIDCGDPIDLRRLAALPATPYCTACQEVHEHERPGHHHR